MSKEIVARVSHLSAAYGAFEVLADISFFPEYADLKDKPFMQDLRVQDLLTMSVGHEKEPLRSVIVMQPDWIRGFLNHPIVAKPGSKLAISVNTP